MREPRFRLELEVTFNEYLGLLWAIDGVHNLPADRQTVKKIARFEKQFAAAHKTWRKEHFKCAGAVYRCQVNGFIARSAALR